MELQTWIGKDFLERTQRTKHNRPKKKKKKVKWDIIKIENFCSSKGMIMKMRNGTTDVDKTLTDFIYYKGFVSGIWEETLTIQFLKVQ